MTRHRSVIAAGAALLVLSVGLAGGAASALADSCAVPLCQRGETFRADSNPAVNYGWCHSSSGLGYRSHQRRDCPAGSTLNRATGLCVRRDCCPEKPLCPAGEKYLRSGTRDGRVYGVCGSSSGLGYRSHTLRYCEAGWTLDTARGVCKKICPVSVTPVTTVGVPVGTLAPAKPAGGKPDLVVRRFALKRWGACKPNNAVMTFEVTVANIGTAPSPAIPGKALVQVRDQHGINWGNGKPLNAIAPGASQTVEIPVYYIAADAAHMTAAAPHPFKAIADPLKLVDELNEGNNDSGVLNMGAPAGCPVKK
ncbi:MAG TPA: CARDB domain-containing protein [Acidiferrobacterales bacterium]